jgi:hypothetical protein
MSHVQTPIAKERCMGVIGGDAQCTAIHLVDFVGVCAVCGLQYYELLVPDDTYNTYDNYPITRIQPTMSHVQTPIAKERCMGVIGGDAQCTAIHPVDFVGVCAVCGLQYYELLVPDDVQ